MDILVLAATGTCVSVKSAEAKRVVDASKRRRPLQEKIGAGLSTDAFAEKKATGTFGHIGLRESLLLVAEGLDITLAIFGGCDARKKPRRGSGSEGMRLE
jgi:4-hydroxy-tetrahydrodipicolinate reductase